MTVVIDTEDEERVAHLAALLLAGRAAHPHLEQIHEENGNKQQAIVREHVKIARLILKTARSA